MSNDSKPAILRQESTTPPVDYDKTKYYTASAYMRKDLTDTHQKATSIPVFWEKSYLCPCRNKDTRQPNPSCKICHGRGIAFFPSTQINTIIQSQDAGLLNTDLGLIDSGTAIASPQREVHLSFRDRITLPTALITQSVIFDVTEKRIEQGFYLIFDVVKILYAVSLKGELVEEKDYTFDLENNRIYPKEHLLGENVSLNIETKLRYMVVDLLKEYRYMREMNQEYYENPQKLLLKREDVFVDKEFFSSNSEAEEGKMVDTKRDGTKNVEGLNGFFGGIG